MSDRSDGNLNSILILTAPIGGGHDSLAQYMSLSLRSSGAAVAVHNMMTTGIPRSLPKLYSFVTRRSPRAYGIYFTLRRQKLFRRANGLFVQRALRSALSAIDMTLYDFVLVMQGVYCHILSELAASEATVVVVATDLFGGAPEWFIKGAAAYVVPSSEMACAGISAGIDPCRLLVRRLPTQAINQRRLRDPSQLVVKRVLITGGLAGVGPIRRVFPAFIKHLPDCSVDVVCGSNQRLLKHINGLREGCLARAYGRIPDLAATYSQYDVVVTKPGTSTVMELFDAGVPFLLIQGIPGIESANSDIISNRLKVSVLSDDGSAGHTLRSLIFESGKLTARGKTWIDELEQIGAQLPDRPLTLEDLSAIAGWQKSGQE